MPGKRMKTAVVGCGAISEIYLKNMIHRFQNLEVVACCASHIEHAQKRAEQFGIRACTYEEILQEKEIELVVVLTPAPTHYELIRRALEAGKHVYTEKTMCIDLEDAGHLLKLADEKGLYLGAAPDTFLGSAWQTARKALDDGMIGDVTSFVIHANRDLDVLAGLFSFLRMPGGGICYDYGVYYLTALVSLLGAVHRVCAQVKNRSEIRVSRHPEAKNYGEEFRYPNESQVTAVLELENGVSGSFVLNGDSAIRDLAVFYIYGTKGVLRLTDPNQFGGDVLYIPSSFDRQGNMGTVLENSFAYSDNSRGVGPAEMADAIAQGRGHRACKEMAYHVLEVIECMMRSSESGRFETVLSRCERPEEFADGGRLESGDNA